MFRFSGLRWYGAVSFISTFSPGIKLQSDDKRASSRSLRNNRFRRDKNKTKKCFESFPTEKLNYLSRLKRQIFTRRKPLLRLSFTLEAMKTCFNWSTISRWEKCLVGAFSASEPLEQHRRRLHRSSRYWQRFTFEIFPSFDVLFNAHGEIYLRSVIRVYKSIRNSCNCCITVWTLFLSFFPMLMRRALLSAAEVFFSKRREDSRMTRQWNYCCA